MSHIEKPFGTIENTQEFLSILSDKIDEILDEARREQSAYTLQKQARRAQAWQLVLYTTMKLSCHIGNSRKLLNDLTALRNLLHEYAALDDAESLGAECRRVEP